MSPSQCARGPAARPVAAPASQIFVHVNNLKNWNAWSPWAKLDPNAKNSFVGPEAGVGALMRWAGNYEVGEGSMLITESKTNELVRFRLDFLKPMESTSLAEFNFVPQGNQTAVTWTMSGTNNFMGKAFGLFFNCEKMVGGKFEEGLSSLKQISEARIAK